MYLTTIQVHTDILVQCTKLELQLFEVGLFPERVSGDDLNLY